MIAPRSFLSFLAVNIVKKKSSINQYFFCGALLLMATVSGCMLKTDSPPVLGANFYGWNFKVDYKNAVESGTYRVGLESNSPHGLGGGASAGTKYYTFWLDFRMKDGREYHEIIDTKILVRELREKFDVPDTRKTQWGGNALIIFYITNNELIIKYMITKYNKKNPKIWKFEREYFPMYKKILD